MAEAAALTADEAKIYDRQIRVWGVETQQRCVLPLSRSPLLSSVLTDALLARADRCSCDWSVPKARCSGAAPWTDGDRVQWDGRLRSAKVLFVRCPGVSAEVPNHKRVAPSPARVNRVAPRPIQPTSCSSAWDVRRRCAPHPGSETLKP
jgi:hypothetical protein